MDALINSHFFFSITTMMITSLVQRQRQFLLRCASPFAELGKSNNVSVNIAISGPLGVQRAWSSRGDDSESTTKTAAAAATPKLQVESESTEWIPPNRPLVGDTGQSHLYAPSAVEEEAVDDDDEEMELRRIEEELERIDQEESQAEDQKHSNAEGAGAPPGGVDWLRTRRSLLSEQQQEGFGLMTPGEAALKKQEMSDIIVVEHKLLTKDEIARCLKSLGGRDIKVVLDDPNYRRMGGANGMVFVTGSNNAQLRTLSDALVRQLRRRKLHELGVVGAELGAEGADDPTESWIVVDCMNYIVHLQTEKTRKTVDLEGLWSGRDPLFQVDPLDEDAVEEYIENHPIPDDYGLEVHDWDNTLKEMQKNRWTAPHRPVTTKKKKHGWRTIRKKR